MFGMKRKSLSYADYMSIVECLIQARNPKGCPPDRYEMELDIVMGILEKNGFRIRYGA